MNRLDDDERAFKKAAIVYLGIVIFSCAGLIAGWTLRGDHDRAVVSACSSALAELREEHHVCTATLDLSWKQGREVAASAARCREAISRMYAKEVK